MKIVLDTNIIYSGLGFNGLCRTVLTTVLENPKDFKIYASIETLAELKIKLYSQKFIKLSGLESNDISEFYRSYQTFVEIVYPTESHDICEDKNDNKFFDLAIESKAKYLISGDNKVLKVKSFKSCKVLSPSQFLKIISKV